MLHYGKYIASWGDESGILCLLDRPAATGYVWFYSWNHNQDELGFGKGITEMFPGDKDVAYLKSVLLQN